MDMPRYGIFQDGGHYDDLDTLDAAIGLAEELLGAVPQGECSTFTVECGGRLLASVTNRRITGTFHMQYWDQREQAVDCGATSFDATAYALQMQPEALRMLRDNGEASGAMGLAHILWEGPCRVEVVDAVCAFFGVASVGDITDEALAFAHGRWGEDPPQDHTIRLTFDVRLKILKGADLGEFIQDLDCRMASRTIGVTVIETQFVDHD